MHTRGGASARWLFLAANFLPVVCCSGICGLGSTEIGSFDPINTLPLDHKSGSHESLLGLLPDINKPPLGAFGHGPRSLLDLRCAKCLQE